ncbi:unnamed protein product [Cyclocybe aegerita]|uniref:Uncharacterized protein n=1 Tax=Cyclocybe aegerita TaxID=1973307 RepID=A0A8S0XX69_CYCAE|nr:unnamed protein product [Cyclocybe aegerita]
MDDAFLFMCRCTSAVGISLDCINEPWSDFFKDNLTSTSWAHTVANLRVLRIANSACDCTPLLQYLKLPSLRVLQMHNFETGADCVSTLEATLSSSRSLRQLSIVDHSMGEVRLWSLLRSTLLGEIPSVGIYTQSKNIKWDMLLDTVPAALNLKANVPRWEKDGFRGGWYGWGPGSLADAHSIY